MVDSGPKLGREEIGKGLWSKDLMVFHYLAYGKLYFTSLLPLEFKNFQINPFEIP
jgi:hypothetical protein